MKLTLPLLLYVMFIMLLALPQDFASLEMNFECYRDRGSLLLNASNIKYSEVQSVLWILKNSSEYTVKNTTNSCYSNGSTEHKYNITFKCHNTDGSIEFLAIMSDVWEEMSVTFSLSSGGLKTLSKKRNECLDFVMAPRGSNVTLKCKLNGTFTLPEWSGPPDLTIYVHQGKRQPNPNVPIVLERRLSWNNDDNMTIIIKSVNDSDGGNYRCVHTEGGTYSLKLVVTVPENITTPVYTTASENTTAHVDVTGPKSQISGIVTGVLTSLVLGMVLMAVLAIYFWRERKRYQRKDIEQAQPLLDMPAKFKKPLTDQTIEVKVTLVMECELTEPNVQVCWQKYGQEITPDSKVQISCNNCLHKLEIVDVTTDDGGIYTCVCGEEKTECTITVTGEDNKTYTDLRLRHLFKDTMTVGEAEVQFLRIMVVGCYGHGKTSLIKRLLGESTKHVETTAGIDVTENMCCTSDFGKWVKLNAEQNRNEIMKNIVVTTKKKTHAKADSLMDTVYVDESHPTITDNGTNILKTVADNSEPEQIPEQVEHKSVPNPETSNELKVFKINKSNTHVYSSTPDIEYTNQYYCKSDSETKDLKLDSQKCSSDHLAVRNSESNVNFEIISGFDQSKDEYELTTQDTSHHHFRSESETDDNKLDKTFTSVPTSESNAALVVTSARAVEDANEHYCKSESETVDLDDKMYKTFAGYVSQEYLEKNWEISLWDFAGQFVYYATHQLFHSKKSLYLLVLDLSKSLDEPIRDEEFCIVKDLKDYMDFWVSSIHSFVGSQDECSYENDISWSPCIILVGTHASDLKEKQQKIQFEKIREHFHSSYLRHHIYEHEFPVDNLSDSDDVFKKLRKEIEAIAKKKIKIETIPNNWNALEIALCDIKNCPIITVSEVREINNKLEFPVREDINLFLIYCHEKGRLFYLEGGSHAVLKPQFLINAFKSIITSKSICLRTKHKTLQPLWNDLFDFAKLKPNCVVDLWKAKLKNATEKDKEELKLFLQHKETIFEFLEKGRIISKFADGKEVVYLVPSFLKADEKKLVEDFTSGKSFTQIVLVFEFQYSPIVPTLFQHTIAAALEQWSPAAFKGQSLVYNNVAAFKIDKESHHVGIISMNGPLIELTVFFVPLDETSSVAKTADAFRRFVAKCIYYEFRKMKEEHIKETEKPFTLKFRCIHEHDNDHKLSSSKTLKNIGDVWNIQRHVRMRYRIPCLDSVGKNVIVIPEAFAEWFLVDLDFKKVLCVELTEKDLSMISSTFFRDFMNVIDQLGKQLGLVEDEQKYNPKDDDVMLVYRMLLKWKEIEEKSGNTALSDDLLHTIGRCEGIAVDQDEIRNFFDDKGHIVSVSKEGYMHMYSETSDKNKWTSVNVKLYSNSALVIPIGQTDQIRIFIKDVWDLIAHGEALREILDNIPALPQGTHVSCLLAVPEKPSCRLTPHYLLFDSEALLKEWMEAIVSIVPQKKLQEDLIAFYRKTYTNVPFYPLMKQGGFPLLKFYVSPTIRRVELTRHNYELPKHDKTVKSYNDIFHDKEEDICRDIYLLSPAGFGKSAFIKRMALAWCHAKDPKDEDKHYFSDYKEDISSIRRFRFVFFVRLRKIEKLECDLESNMIMNQIIKHLTRCSNFTEQQILEIFEKEECLIMIDGLDQWSHPADKDCRQHNLNIPHRKHREKTTILTTSRLWRYAAAELKSHEVDQLLELSGLDGSSANLLIDKVIACLNTEQPTHKHGRDFCNIFDKSRANVLKSVPFILIQLLCLWYKTGKLGNSYCEVYENMIKFLFRSMPDSNEDNLSKHHYEALLDALSALAYDMLKYEHSVYILEDTIHKYVQDPSDINLCLVSGIIIDSGKSPEGHQKYSFLHKTFQEYLASYYLSRSANFQQFSDLCTSIKSMLAMENFFMFLCGMSWEVPVELNEHLRKIINEDKCTKQYRFESKGSMWFIDVDFFFSRLLLPKLQTLMIDCLRESKGNTNCISLPLEDYFLYDDIEYHMPYLSQLLNMNQSHIKSILLKTKFTVDKNKELLQKLNNYNIISLEALSVKCDITDKDISVILEKNAKHLQFLEFGSNIRLPASFDKITALNNLVTLSLAVVRVPHTLVNKLTDTLVIMKQLRHLSFYRVSCEEHKRCKMKHFNISALTKLQALKLVDCEDILPDNQINICPYNMEECTLTSSNRSNIIRPILTCLQHAQRLTTLVLSDFKDRKDVDCLRDLLPTMKTLKCIYISHIDFENKPLVITSEMKFIEQLKIHFCQLTNEAIYNFAKCISDIELPLTVYVDIVDCIMETRDKKPGWWNIKHLCKLHFTKDSKGKHGRTLCFNKKPTGHK